MLSSIFIAGIRKPPSHQQIKGCKCETGVAWFTYAFCILLSRQVTEPEGKFRSQDSF